MPETMDSTAEQGLTVHARRWDPDGLSLVCGIANAGGGILLLPSSQKDYGASSRRIKRSFEAIPNEILEKLGLQGRITPIMDGGEFFLELEVPAATEPVGVDGVYWLYEDGRNVRQTPEEIFRNWQDEASTSWELKALPYVEYDDLSTDALLDIASLPASSLRDVGATAADNISARLDHLGLTHPRTKKLINAGGLLLCINPARFIPGASVHIIAFDAEGAPTGEQDEVVGPLAHQIDEAVRLVMEKYLPSISTGRSFVQKCPPEEALREAMTNALLHKDYAQGAPVRVMVSPSQIVVQNVGGVPEDWTEENLLQPHAPHLRNPLLATTARLLQLTPGWGEGTRGMLDACELAGAEAPRFELGPDRTEVSFPLPASRRGQRPAKDPGRTAESAFATRGGSADRPRTTRLTFAERSVAGAHRIDLTQTDEHVLQILTTNGRATAPRIAQVLGVSERTVRRSFKKLRDYGFIERIGSDKAGFWSVLD